MAITLVAQTAKGSADATNVTTGAINSTGATMTAIFSATTSGGTVAPTDNKGNTYVAFTAETVIGGERGCWYYANANTGTFTVGAGHTASLVDTSNLPSIALLAFAGTTTGTVTQENAGNQGFGTSATSGSFTPTSDNSLVLQGLAYNVASTVATLGESYVYTQTGDLDYVDKTANNMGIAVGYLIQTSKTATNPAFTLGTTASWVMVGIAADEAGGGGGGGGSATRDLTTLLCGQ